MVEDQIKQAFSMVKQDISQLKNQLNSLKQDISELKRTLNSPTDISLNQTDRQQTDNTSTHNLPLEALKPLNSHISIGNEGVSTDRQTDKQTDNKLQKFAQIYNSQEKKINHEFSKLNSDKQEEISQIDVSNVLNSLNSLKSSISGNFKSLTKQEFLVFSTLYIQQESNNTVSYQSIAKKLSLTESSIRDYIQRIMKKGIPLNKTKINNKKIILTIPLDFKKITSLDTITQIREDN